jgi:FHA domain
MNRGNVVQPSKQPEPHSKRGDGPPPSGRSGGATCLRTLEIEWRLVGVEPVGFGFAAWLACSPGLPELWTCSAEGRDGARALRIGETGQVPEIEVENLTDMPVLVPAHLVVTGGWQTRAVERSAVIPARARARVPVKCVEAGRWAPRDEKTAAVFEVAHRAGVRTRWSTSLNMVEQLRRNGRFAAEQSAVWQHVEEELSRSPEPSHTRSYEAYLRGVQRSHLDAVRRAGVRAPEGANAVIIFPRGGGFWLDALATPQALAVQASDLLADLFDGSPRDEAEPREAPRVEALLHLLWSAPLRAIEQVAGTVGAAYALASRIQIGKDGPRLVSTEEGKGPADTEATGVVLVVDRALAHISIGSAPPRPALERRADEVSADGRSLHRAEASASRRVEIADGRSADAASARPANVAPRRLVVADADAPRAGSFEVRPAPPSFGAVSAPSAPVNDGGRALGHGASGAASASGASGVAPRAEAPGAPERAKIGRDTMRAIYARARDLLPFEPPPRREVQGYRLMRVLDGNLSWVDIRVSGDGYAVLGSHDRCDLVLASDAGIWLRHMIAICVRLEDDSVALRLIDLKTDVPFFLENDEPQWAVLATGSFAIRIGRHVVCGFPIGATSDDDAPEPQAAAPGRGHTFESLSRSRAAILETSAGDMSAPLIRSMRPRDEPFTIVPAAPVSQIQELVGPSASPNHVRVTLERGGMGASVEIPAEALDTGVLLGRALNCFDGGLRRIFCDAVSRAHVLLLRDRDEVHALDLCTTNGTRVSGRRIRRYRLSNDGSTLELGKKVLFRWHRRLVESPSGPSNRGNPGEGQASEIRHDSGEQGSRPPE